MQRLREEARVHQMQDRVLDPADVLVDRQPVVDHAAVERPVVVVRVGVAQEVPGRVDERVHRVRLALRRHRRTRGTSTLTQSSAAASGERPFGRKSSTSGSSTGSSSSGTGTITARLAVDDRDRAAPVALPRQQPVAQPVVDRRLRRARAPSSDSTIAFFASGADMPLNCARVDEHLVGGVRDVGGAPPRPRRQTGATTCTIGRSNRCREGEVALVVRGHGHDRAGAVVHQDVVGDPDRDARVVHGVDRVEAGEDAGLLLVAPRAPRSSSPAACRAYVAQLARRCGARSANRSTSGCSGASTKNVAPNSVSGRVVKTGTSSSSSSIAEGDLARPPSGRSSSAASSARARATTPAAPCRRAGGRRSR